MQRSNNPLIIDPGAEDDVTRLSVFYATREDGNGEEILDLESLERFLEEFYQTNIEIRDYPLLNGFCRNPFRRRHFPSISYLAIYEALENMTVVYAVAHAHEKPENLLRRLNPRKTAREND